jgi:hypothetical protein
VRWDGPNVFGTIDIYSLTDAILVAMEPWSVAHHVFVYTTFIETGRSVVLTQRRFQNNFNVGHHGRVPKRDTIMKYEVGE